MKDVSASGGDRLAALGIDLPHPFIRREVFSLPEGPVSFVFPDRMSAESARETVEWMSLLQRKITRWAVVAPSLREDTGTADDALVATGGHA